MNNPLPAALQQQNDPVEFARTDILNRLAQIEAGLTKLDPQIPVHLGNIHKTLAQYEELVHILPDDRIRITMQAYQQFKQVKLVEEATTKKGPGRKSLSKTTLDDI